VRAGRSLSRRRRISYVLAVLVCAVSCSAPESKTVAKRDPVTIRIGVAIPKSNDSNSGVRSLIGNQTSEQLVGLALNGRPVDRLASGTWAPDGLALTLNLKKNLAFHDGTPIDANFLQAGVTEFLNGSSLNYKARKSVASIDVEAADRLKIRLARPEALLLADLSNLLVSHPTKRTVGVGPYRLVEGPPNRLEKFEAYYRGRPQIEFVQIREFDEQRSAFAALLRSEIDAVHEITPEAMPFVQGQTGVKVFPITRPYFISLIFNTHHPVLKSAKVRQALSYAIDRESIIKLGLNGQGVAAVGPIWPSHWAYSAAPKSYSRNVEASTITLDSTGLRMKPGVKGQMPSRARFRCLTIPRFEKIALVVQKQLYEIGIDLDVQMVQLPELLAKIKTGDFDTVLTELTSGRSLVWTYYFFHSTGMSFGYKSADAPLDAMRAAKDDNEVRAAVSDFQQTLFDDPPAIFLAWPQVARVVSTKFAVPPLDENSSKDVISNLWQWKPAGADQ
jgi:ABC-type transport system substrate-binding protein